MILIAHDTNIFVSINGKHSFGKASWFASRMGDKRNLLDPNCTKINEILDLGSMDRLVLDDCGQQDFLEIETNYSPRVGMNLIFCAPLGTRLALYAGGYVTALNPASVNGCQLRGVSGMYCVTAVRHVKRKAYNSNVTSLSTVLIDRRVEKCSESFQPFQTTTQTLGHRQQTMTAIAI